jgi:hypothetical protein
MAGTLEDRLLPRRSDPLEAIVESGRDLRDFATLANDQSVRIDFKSRVAHDRKRPVLERAYRRVPG